jgi:predicted aspartyl protease
MLVKPFLLTAALALVGTGAANPDAAFKAGDFAAARAGYAQQVRQNRRDVDALLGLATTELYDNDLSAVQNDLKRAMELQPANARARQLQRTLDLRIGGPGEFQISQQGAAVLRFVAEHPLPVVRMRIEGADANVMIDTGAPNLVITQTFAAAHHFSVRNAGIGIFAGGRRAAVQATTVRSISAETLTVSNVRANVMPAPGPGVDAVIGTGFFAHFLATLDYKHHRLVLRPRNAKAPATSLANVPMWLVGDHFIFAQASVNGGAPSLYNIDSGAGIGVQMTKDALHAAKIAPKTGKPASFMGGGGAARIFPFVANCVTIGGARQRNVQGVYFPDGDQYGAFPFTVAGTVSGGFLGHYAVTFDFKAMRLILQ